MAEINASQDIVPLTKFRSKVSEYINQTKLTNRPIVITQHGHGSAVLLSAEEYDKLKNTIAVLRRGAQVDMDSLNGKTVPHEKAMNEIENSLKAKTKKSDAKRKSA